MTTLTRWEPFAELATMRNVMDQIFNDPLSKNPALGSNGGSYPMALDIAEDAGSYTVKASLPGIKPEEVEITLDKNVLSIKGASKEESEKTEGTYHLRERRTGSFYRSVSLPANVDAEKIEAVNANGVLTLTLPKSEEAKPKKIAVKNVVIA